MPDMPPEMPSAPDAEAESKVVCIAQQADGSFTVGNHAAYMSQQGEEQGEEMGEKPSMTPAASLDEALEMAGKLLQDDGRSPEEQVQAGYNSGKKPMMGKPSIGAIFGE